MSKYNSADKNSIKDVEDKEKDERIQYLEDLKKILDTKEGIRFFRKFLADGYIFRTTFTGNSQTFFLEGQRNLALKYFNDICDADPTKLQTLMLQKKETEEE